MDRSDVITLIAQDYTRDGFGVWQPTTKEKNVFCQVDSITRAEFYDAGRNGLNPEFRFTIFFGDYSGEKVVRFHGEEYAVYRTYRGRTDRLELYVERQGGTNGTGDD